MRLGYSLEPDDELDGAWSREQLVDMNARFVAALNRAIELGLESRASAAGRVKLPATLGPRWVTPLTPEIRDALWRSSAANALVFIVR